MSDRKPTRGVAVEGTRIWLDVSSLSAVLVCDVCQWQAIAFSKDDAKEQGTKHMLLHPGVKVWGPRFVGKERPCRADDDCEGVHSKAGYCSKHYELYIGTPRRTQQARDRAVKEKALADKRAIAEKEKAERAARAKAKPIRKVKPKPVPKPRKVQPETCTQEDCINGTLARNLCRKHYDIARRENGTSAHGLLCERELCNRAATSRAMCNLHYTQEWKRSRTKDAA